MILKEQKKCAVVLLITGAVMFLTTWLTEDSHGFDFLNGLGCGFFFAWVLCLLRITGLAVILKRQRITIYMLKMNARPILRAGLAI